MLKLEISHLTKYYGDKCALKELSCELSEGIYGLLGPNGAGKTTLMTILVSNMKPTNGTVLFDGNDIFTLGRRYRKLIGYMPQQQGMYDYFTGFYFLSYMAALKGMDSKYAITRIKEVARSVNLESNLGKKIGSYSGGMKQRLLIAQALLDEPKIIVLDEPTAGLDPKERIRIRNLISEIAENKIVLIATHVVQDIEYIAKEIIMLKQGNLICKSTADELVYNMEGKVYEISCRDAEIKEILKDHLVTNIYRVGDEVKLRVICEEKLAGDSIKNVTPTIEDCYLYEFQDEGIFDKGEHYEV